MKDKLEIKQTQPKPQYFWEKITTKQIQRATTVLFILFCLAPIFCSLTVKLWAKIMSGEYDNTFAVMQMNGYWYFIIGIISAVLSFVMIYTLIHFIKHTVPLNETHWLSSHWLPLFLSILLLWSIISTCFAADKELAIMGNEYCNEGLLMFFFYAAFFVAATTLNKKQIKIISEIMLIVCTVTGILIITQGRIFPNLFYLNQDIRAVMFHNNNHYGYFLAVCIPLIFGLCLNDRYQKPVFKILRLIEFWFILNAAAYNSCRGSFLAYFLVIIFWNIYIFSLQRDKKKKILFLDLFFLLTILLFNTNSVLFERMTVLMKELLGLFHNSDKKDLLDHIGSNRGFLWRYTVQLSLKKPIFGYGPANLDIPFQQVGCIYGRPHNDLLLILGSMGYPAVLFYLTALGGHLNNFLKNIRKMDMMELTIFSVVGSYLISSLTGNSFYYTAPYYFIFLGFSYRVCKNYE